MIPTFLHIAHWQLCRLHPINFESLILEASLKNISFTARIVSSRLSLPLDETSVFAIALRQSPAIDSTVSSLYSCFIQYIRTIPFCVNVLIHCIRDWVDQHY